MSVWLWADDILQMIYLQLPDHAFVLCVLLTLILSFSSSPLVLLPKTLVPFLSILVDIGFNIILCSCYAINANVFMIEARLGICQQPSDHFPPASSLTTKPFSFPFSFTNLTLSLHRVSLQDWYQFSNGDHVLSKRHGHSNITWRGSWGTPL